MKRFSILALSVFLVLVFVIPLFATSHTPDARMLRFPDVSKTQIVFVYAGDIWVVAKEGGIARKLSSPKGQELFPKFSPDGQQFAFSGNYDGNIDVYVMPAEGGEPKRLTHHPGDDLMVEWYPDGVNILYRSGMYSPSRRFNKFFRQPISGGMPQVLPLPFGEIASFSPDGKRLAFQYISREFRTWKRYRGGMASDLWIFDFATRSAQKFTDFPGTDALPMWHGNTIYFLSDRDKNKKLNLWAYDTTSKQTRQITSFKKYDVKWPSLGPDDIVFENGGQLYLLNLTNETTHPVSIQVPSDLPEIRSTLKDASKNIQSFSLSPSGKRALFEARGDIFTVPEKHGSVRDLTRSSGVAERYPAWSPDGKYVAYFSDETGEYELYIRPGDGSGQAKRITKDGHTFRYQPVWAPDSKHIAFSDKSGKLFVLNIDDGKPVLVDKDEWDVIYHYAWSPDSHWLTYAKNMANHLGAIMIYDVTAKKIHQITSGFYNDSDPVFDPEGSYLYFLSNRTFKPIYGDMDNTWIYPNSTNLYAVTLQKSAEPPTAPRNDEEEVKKDEEKGKEKSGKGQNVAESKKKEEKKIEPVKIDFDGMESRVVKIPVKVGNGEKVKAVKGKVLFLRYPPAGAGEPGKPGGTLVYWDLKEREEKSVISGINAYDLSADGKKVIYKSKSTYGIIDLAAGKKVGDGKIATDKMKMWINPRQEWRQIFTEAWRIERDFFYDPGMHGLDWKAVRKRYEVLLPFVVDRTDLNYVIGEMIAELNSSHSYVGGGDIERPPKLSVGLLGCDFELDRQNNAYRIAKIYSGAPWDEAATRSPLRRPGLDVKEGDYILAVNGEPIDTSQDPWAAFQGLAGETIILTINQKPTPDGAHDIVVKPISSERHLRNLAWINRNRERVEKATNGRVGYIYVPDTGRNGQNELVRQFTPQYNKDGLIIDERFNSGGQIPDRFIELLNRPIYNYWARRDFGDWRTPFLAHDGPKVMLINGWSGSGGDAFPYYFRKAGLGPLVGTRTWGGLIGISGNPQLIDGGFVTAPSFGFWNTEGKWDVEGYGVDPDYKVDDLPATITPDCDPQLDKAIEVIKTQLQKHAPVKLHKPRYPDRSK